MRIRRLSHLVLNSLFAAVVLTSVSFAGTTIQRDPKMKEEFLKAVTDGAVERVKEMLRSDASLARAIDEKGVSAILKATYYGKRDVVVVLLGTGIELNIFEAAATGSTSRVRELAQRDSSLINSYSGDGFMPLGLATFFGHLETVELLLSLGADVNAASRESMKVTPLHSAAASRNVAIARLLIAKGANVNARQAEMNFTPLHEVALNGQIEFAALLLDNGAEINAATSKGKTPLGYAVEGNHEQMAAYLRKRGAK